MADLERMSLDDLCALKDGIDALVGAGRVLVKAGHVPVFDLTPGRDVRILNGFGVPGLTLESEPESEHEPAASLLPAVAEAPAAVPPDAAGAGDPTETESCQPRDGGTRPMPSVGEPGGRAGAGAHCPPRTGPAMPVAAVPQRANLPERWTEDEDRRAVGVAVALLESGGSMAAAARAVATTTGRTQAAVRYRLDHVLKDRIEALMAREPAPVPQAEPAAAPELVEVAPTPAPEAVADPVEAYLRGLGPTRAALRDGLSIFEDACAGLDMNTIAIRLEVSPKSVRESFELLTNKRAFGREAVRDALRRMCGALKISP